MIAEPIQVLLSVVDRLDRLGIPYAVGGSLSSSVFGEPRSSADVDLLITLAPVQASALAAAFDGEFYVDVDAVVDAVRRKSSFNVIHLATMLKADLFVAGPDLLDQEQLRRRRAVVVAQDPARSAFITAPENIVLRKLDWYRRGGSVSDQQWRDVLGVLKAQGTALDREYLSNVARAAGLDELVARALADAGLDSTA
jgi:predicted nucleotidyltransferase